jgi:hypothetical protein
MDLEKRTARPDKADKIGLTAIEYVRGSMTEYRVSKYERLQ